MEIKFDMYLFKWLVRMNISHLIIVCKKITTCLLTHRQPHVSGGYNPFPHNITFPDNFLWFRFQGAYMWVNGWMDAWWNLSFFIMRIVCGVKLLHTAFKRNHPLALLTSSFTWKGNSFVENLLNALITTHTIRTSPLAFTST